MIMYPNKLINMAEKGIKKKVQRHEQIWNNINNINIYQNNFSHYLLRI